MHKAIAIIGAFLTEKEMKHQQADINGASVIEIGISGKMQ